MKKTLLELVQDILSDLDFDEVNSIDDTIQSVQVASIVKNCYFGMIGNRNWPHLKKLFQLESVGDVSKPVFLKLPEALKEMESIRYQLTDGTFKDLKYRTTEEFLRMCSTRLPAEPFVDVISDYSGVKLNILNNADPSYWTSFDDVYLVFDSYDAEIETTVQASKTQCIGYLNPTWVTSDSFIPNLPIEAFPALFEEAKSTASLNIKQMGDQKAELNSVKQQRWLSRKAWRAAGGIEYPDYGRKARR